LAEQVAADRGIRRSEAVAVAAATGADQVLTLDELLGVEPLTVLRGGLGQRGAAAVLLDVGADRVDLAQVHARGLLRHLRFLAHGRHAAGLDLEVDRGLADADQARTALGDALQVRAVARDAGLLVEPLALADQRGLIGLVCLRDLRGRRQGRSGQTGTGQRAEHQGDAGSATTQLAALLGPGRIDRGLRRRLVAGIPGDRWRCWIHRYPSSCIAGLDDGT